MLLGGPFSHSVCVNHENRIFLKVQRDVHVHASNAYAMLADAAWESFVDKKEVTSSNLEHMIQKTLQNIHWERKPRTRAKDDEDEWDARRRRRAIMFDDEDDEIATANSNNNDQNDQEEGRDDKDDDVLVHDHNHVPQDIDCGGRALSSQGYTTTSSFYAMTAIIISYSLYFKRFTTIFTQT